MALDNKDRIDIENDHRNISEDGQSIQGNVFDNDIRERQLNQTGGTNEYAHVNLELTVENGSLSTDENTNTADDHGLIQGKYGTLQLNSDGSYVYTLTKDMNYLGAGVDLHDEVFYFNTEWNSTTTNAAGDDENTQQKITIDIHGENDEPVIKDVCVSAYEGLDGDAKLLGSLGTGVAVAGDNVDFVGQLVIEDQDATKDGLQADGDTGDVHKLVIDESTIKMTSDDLTAAQIAAIKATINAQLVDGTLTVAEDGTPVANFGKFTVDGNFDALSVGDEACVTFEYYVEDTSSAGEVTKGLSKTVSVKVLGTNDAVIINDDAIVDYHDLIDGDLYKSILANDTHATTLAATTDPANIAVKADVNDTLTVTDTIRTDLQFVNEGGQICVDNAAQSMRYQPGTGDIIAKDHFEFTYAASDGYTDPIGTATVAVAMKNQDDADVDFYQFGDAGDNSLVGSAKSDMLSGGNGNDSINGGAGADILYGGAGQDCIVAGAGNDIVIGGKGNDSMCDTGGSDKYVFAKGDGCDSISDLNEQFIYDAAGHLVENADFDNNKDIVHFDDTVDQTKIAVFMNGDTLEIKYSDDCDVVRVKDQNEAHYGIEAIEVHGANTEMTKGELDGLLTLISTYDIDASQAGVQTAQSVNDVYNNAGLMTQINAAFA